MTLNRAAQAANIIAVIPAIYSAYGTWEILHPNSESSLFNTKGILIAVAAMVACVMVGAVLNTLAGFRKDPSLSPAPPSPAPPPPQPAPPPPPRLLILFQPNEGRPKLLLEASGAPVRNVRLGPVAWREKRALRLVGANSSLLLPGKPTEGSLLVQDADKTWTAELCEFLREKTPADAEVIVEISYEDDAGRKLVQPFSLTTDPHGNVSWAPGPVRIDSEG